MPKVWRTMRKTVSSGFFVWEVNEVDGDIVPRLSHLYTPTLDGGYIYVQCFHFFKEEVAEYNLNENDELWGNELIVIK